MKKNLILILLINLFVLNYGIACTTAIISGEVTKDGRPILWKHRDAENVNNIVRYFSDGKYPYIGLVDANDVEGNSVWIGCNSTGFAIMNSASYNLKNDTTNIKDKEGELMKKALQQCASIDDFENFLKNYPQPYAVEANFGVIDAQGNAAYFETNNYSFTKIDVNDKKVAPHGYVIRTNFSFTGRIGEGHGYIRYFAAEEQFFNISSTNDLNVKSIFQNVTRNLKHGLTKVNLKDESTNNPNEVKYVNFEDFIPRESSVSSVIIHGTKAGESPEFTTFWVVLGFPLTSVAVPVWVKNLPLPTILVASKEGKAPLCNKSLDLKKRCIPIKRGSGYKYININALYNRSNTGIMQQLSPLENKIFLETEIRVESFKKSKVQLRDKLIKDYYLWIDKTVNDEYLKLFGI